MKRRDFLIRATSAGLAGSCLLLNCYRYKKYREDVSQLYLKKCLEIFRLIQNQELPKLSHVAIRAAEIYKGGGKLHSHLTSGEMLQYETRFNRAGNPGYFVPLAVEEDQAILDTIQRGDFFLTDKANSKLLLAKQQGIYVVGISVPFLPHKFTPSDRFVIKPDWYPIEDIANVVLYSHVPIEDGVVSFPEYPMVPLCPASSIIQSIYFWMLNAEIAYQVQVEKTYPFISRARDYIEKIIERIYELEKQTDLMYEAARRMAENVKVGGTLYVYEQSRSLIAEACNRASGLMLTKPLLIDAVKPRDNVIFGAESSNQAADIELARQLRNRKCFVVTISPFDTDGQTEGPLLRKAASLALNNLSGESQGVVKITKEAPPLCPAGGVLNAIILWALTAQFVAEMINLGMVPYVIMGEHLIGGAEYNAAVRRFFIQRGF